MNTKMQARYEAAIKHVEAAKTAITETIGEGWDAGRIGTKVNELAFAEGAVSFWDRMVAISNHYADRGEELTLEVATQKAFGLLTRGADDTWSGRGNDVNRARFDGLRDAADKLEYTF